MKDFEHVLTLDQKLGYQTDALIRAGYRGLLNHKMSSSPDGQPNLNKTLETLREGN